MVSRSSKVIVGHHHRRHHSEVWAAAITALLAISLGGCRSCANDHPYVPPQADAASSSGAVTTNAESSASSSGSISDSGLAANVEPALVAPPNATSWAVEGMTLEPGGGREVALALVRDFDGDGKKDALAVVRLPLAERKPGTPTGELVFFHGGDGTKAPGAIAIGPPLAMQPSCSPIARLEKIGPRSAFAEIGSGCVRGAGSRSIVVVRLTGPMPAVSFDALVLDPTQAPKLNVDIDAADRDKDGIDDAVLRLTIEGEARPKTEKDPAAGNLSAKLIFFDRPAGPSRDPEEPEASLKAIASQATSRAAKAKEAPNVPALVAQMRALYRAMCIEGGAPRVTNIHGGSAPSCGTSKALEDAGVAEVRAWSTQGDALRAFVAAESAQVAPATKTAAKTAELSKILNDAAPSIEVKGVRTLPVATDVPRGSDGIGFGSLAGSGSAIEWGPLAFEYTGKLIVRHGKTVSRVDPDSGESEPADMIWKDDVVSPDGKRRWHDAYHACEGVALQASFAPIGEGEMTDVPLPIAPRLGKSCGSGGRGETVSATPIAWGPRGLEAIVAGHAVLIKDGTPQQATLLPAFLDETPPPGSPRSHNAKNIVFMTPFGLIVRGKSGDKWNMVRSPDLEPYADVKKCTISDDASKIACVRRGKVLLVSL